MGDGASSTRCLPCPQLFNIYPRLGALLQLHRPVLRKIEEVQAILRALLKAPRAPAPRGGPVHSYVDALRQQSQVGASPSSPPGLGHPGPTGSSCPHSSPTAGGFPEPLSPPMKGVPVQPWGSGEDG